MKRFILLFVFIMACFQASFAQQAAISFDTETHDYGNIAYMGDGSHVFTYTNTGDAPLIISDCKGSCGCTVPSWSKEPVMPGEKGSIIVKYDTKRGGKAFQKSVRVYTNTETAMTLLKIKGFVENKPVATNP